MILGIIISLLGLFMIFFPLIFINLYIKIRSRKVTPILGPGRSYGKGAVGMGVKYSSNPGISPWQANSNWVRFFGLIALLFGMLNITGLIG